MRQIATCLLLSAFLLASCTPGTDIPTVTPVGYNPFVPLDGNSPVVIPTSADGTPYVFPTPTEGPFIVPTAIPLEQLLPTARPAGVPIYTPTPDKLRVLPTARHNVDQYVVQAGDTLGSIAQSYGVGLEALMQANGLLDANLLEVGQTLVIPVPEPGAIGSALKIIPDSELVYGPASALFNIENFIKERNGYLASFSQEVNGENMSAAQVITLVAQNYSVNPRLLLALIEHRSGWVDNAAPFQTDFALGIADPSRAGLYLQLTYAANELNRGYYQWRANTLSAWVLADGSVVPIDGGINAGTAGVQNLFSKLDDRAAWQVDMGNAEGSLFYTYFFLFGSPFDFAVDPVTPDWIHQPRFALPFERGVTWAFTGGPHGGWDAGSAWAALDFAPIDETLDVCQSVEWVTAVTNGLIIRADDGQVVQDIDSDGYEQTGWVVLYLHVDTGDLIHAGDTIKGGDRIGHPSCLGGKSDFRHLHIARKYNGEWVSAGGAIPFVFDGWISSSTGNEYDGFLTRGNIQLEALEGITEVNMITR
jgi:LysM repeat protein